MAKDDLDEEEAEPVDERSVGGVGDSDTDASRDEDPGWNRCSWTEASLFKVTSVPVSFLHLRQMFSIRSGVLFRKSSVILLFSAGAWCWPLTLDFKLASRVGKACFNKVTVLLHLLNVEAMASTSTRLILFFLLITPDLVCSTLVSS